MFKISLWKADGEVVGHNCPLRSLLFCLPACRGAFIKKTCILTGRHRYSYHENIDTFATLCWRKLPRKFFARKKLFKIGQRVFFFDPKSFKSQNNDDNPGFENILGYVCFFCIFKKEQCRRSSYHRNIYHIVFFLPVYDDVPCQQLMPQQPREHYPSCVWGLIHLQPREHYPSCVGGHTVFVNTTLSPTLRFVSIFGSLHINFLLRFLLTFKLYKLLVLAV